MTEATALSDRELDALLAEHLFGVRDPIVIVKGQPVQVGQPGDTASVFGYFAGYSSTGDGMLLVIEAMRERGWRFDCASGPLTYEVQFTGEFVDAYHRGSVHNASLPRAVAEAAAAAIQAEEAGA